MRERARRLGEEIADEMRGRVPVKTGGLRDSIRVEDDPDNVGVIVLAGGTPETMRPTADGRGEFSQALLVEFGTEHAPAQPFFRPVVNEYQKRIAEEMHDAAYEGSVEILED